MCIRDRLYRIVDITMEQTLAGKLFGTGTLIITAKADKTPEIRLENIARPREIRQMLSQLVEESRHRRNVVVAFRAKCKFFSHKMQKGVFKRFLISF